MVFAPTQRQLAAIDLQGSDATHCMLFGGARSGKTFIHLWAIISRALAYPSRHAVLRHRFNTVKKTVVLDTLPKVMEICYPEAEKYCELNKTDWYYVLPAGESSGPHTRKFSEIWFGGLDTKERADKILGQEFATIFLNECSEISWHSRNIAMTRLAQNTPLRNKAFYDCNPASQAHWTYQVFEEKKSPDTRRRLEDAEKYVSLLMNPEDNRENLDEATIESFKSMPLRYKERFYYGRYASVSDSALWTTELIEQCRMETVPPDMIRIVVAIDPSGCSGEEDTRSDEVGIVVAGLGEDGKGYVIEDCSGRYGPADWARVACDAFERHEADTIVAETNYGGAMVGEVIRAQRPGTPFREVKASRGKVVRAEPIAALYEQGKVYHLMEMPELEDQLCAMTMSGYQGSKSPDRADALVWALSSLFNTITRKKRDSTHKLQTRAITGRDARGIRKVGPKRHRGHYSNENHRYF